MRVPKAIQNLIESFEKLPGVGPKTAQRLTFYLLHVPQIELDRFALSLQNLKKETVICSTCFSIDEKDPCSICLNPQRDKSVICVVEQPLDALALEKNGKYKGVYHVLHGRIDPLNSIGPDEIFINQLIGRINGSSENERSQSAQGRREKEEESVKEIIIATNPTLEGEATAMYISKQLKTQNLKLKITRIGRGLPVGADIEYADEVTLQRAMEGRSEY